MFLQFLKMVLKNMAENYNHFYLQTEWFCPKFAAIAHSCEFCLSSKNISCGHLVMG